MCYSLRISVLYVSQMFLVFCGSENYCDNLKGKKDQISKITYRAFRHRIIEISGEIPFGQIHEQSIYLDLQNKYRNLYFCLFQS